MVTGYFAEIEWGLPGPARREGQARAEVDNGDR